MIDESSEAGTRENIRPVLSQNGRRGGGDFAGGMRAYLFTCGGIGGPADFNLGSGVYPLSAAVGLLVPPQPAIMPSKANNANTVQT